MYQLINARGLSKSPGSQWKDYDLATQKLSTLFKFFDELYLIVHEDGGLEDIYVDFKRYQIDYEGSTLTLSQWLYRMGGSPLKTVDEIPSSVMKYVRYSDAIQSGYVVDKPYIGVNVPNYFPINDQTTAILRRDTFNTDLSLIDSHCLVSVNGFFHRTSAEQDVAYILDGLSTLRRSGHNQVGILSFLDIASIEKIQLEESQVVTFPNDNQLKDRICLQLETSLVGKTPLLVLGGYLVPLFPNTFWQVSDTLLAVNLSSLPLMERIFESWPYLDLSFLGLTMDPNHPDRFSMNELLSDAVLKKYFTLSQSFVVLVNTPKLTIRKHPLQTMPFPGKFITPDKPVYPLVVGYGRCAEYWSKQEGDRWSLSIQDSFYRHYSYSGLPTSLLGSVWPTLTPEETFSFSRGYFLEIGADTSIQPDGIARPKVILPQHRSTHYGSLVTLESSEFITLGISDHHIATSWKISESLDGTNPIIESLSDALHLLEWGALTLVAGKTYYAFVKHHGNRNVSDWSLPTQFTVQLTYQDPTIQGPDAVWTGETALYIIANYNANVDYQVSAIYGDVSINGHEITYIAPASGVADTLLVNDQSKEITVNQGVVIRPEIISPTSSDIYSINQITATATLFESNHPFDNATKAEWIIAENSQFTLNPRTFERTSGDLHILENISLEVDKTYYLKMRYTNAFDTVSNWSPVVVISTQPTPLVPIITGPNTLAAGEIGTYLISNYSEQLLYRLTVVSGTVTSIGNSITYTAPTESGVAGFFVTNTRKTVIITEA